MAYSIYQKYAVLITVMVLAYKTTANKNHAVNSGKKLRPRQLGLGMDMSMGLDMNMAMNMVPTTLSRYSVGSMSNPLSLQMPFAPNPFHSQMYPTRRHQLSLDGNGQDFLEQPLNPYEKVLNSKYPTSPFERIFGKAGPPSTASPALSAVLSSYQTNSVGSGFDDQGSSGYMGSYESGDFAFGRRSAAMGKSKLLRLSTVRSDVVYTNEAYADYFGW